MIHRDWPSSHLSKQIRPRHRRIEGLSQFRDFPRCVMNRSNCPNEPQSCPYQIVSTLDPQTESHHNGSLTIEADHGRYDFSHHKALSTVYSTYLIDQVPKVRVLSLPVSQVPEVQ
jgi:hypothetical protein